jgi:hypothetical protein
VIHRRNDGSVVASLRPTRTSSNSPVKYCDKK